MIIITIDFLASYSHFYGAVYWFLMTSSILGSHSGRDPRQRVPRHGDYVHSEKVGTRDAAGRAHENRQVHLIFIDNLILELWKY